MMVSAMLSTSSSRLASLPAHTLTSHLVEEPILVSIQVSWPDNSSPIKGRLDQLLTLSLGAQESRGRVLTSIEVRNVDKA